MSAACLSENLVIWGNVVEMGEIKTFVCNFEGELTVQYKF